MVALPYSAVKYKPDARRIGRSKGREWEMGLMILTYFQSSLIFGDGVDEYRLATEENCIFRGRSI